MRILYINVNVMNRGWGAECFIDRGFLKGGHVTHNLDYRKYRFSLGSKFVEISDFDVLLLQRGDYFPLDLLEATHRPMFFWASELVSRCRDQDRLLKSGLFKHVFVHSKACEREVVRLGWLDPDRVSVLLNGFDEAIHRPLGHLEKDIDILFVGSMLPRRRKILDRLQKNFSVTVCQAFGEEMVRLLNRAKIVLNIHAEDFSDTETRIFEALGCGAFVLTEKLSEENPFVSGEHLVEAADMADLEAKLHYFLDHQEARLNIAERGHAEATANHTYSVRAREIADIMSKFSPTEGWSRLPFDLTRIRQYRRREKISAASVVLRQALQRQMIRFRALKKSLCQ